MRFYFFIIFIFFNFLSYCQNSLEDVVYLKDGSIIRGVIVEQVPNEMIKIETRIGNVLAYKFSEIDKITKENSGGAKSNNTVKNGNNTIVLSGKSSGRKHSKSSNNNTSVLPVSQNNEQTAKDDNKFYAVSDVDGNVYKTVLIGNQEWMTENLKVDHFNDGIPIPMVNNNNEWKSITVPAYCFYEDNPTYNNQYGKLYNWYVVSTSHNICPSGWHVPNNDDWKMLLDYLGGDSIAGNLLKSTKYWNENRNGDNSTGFNALPAGLHRKNGLYQTKGEDAFFWSATQKSDAIAWCYLLYFNDNYLYKDGTSKNDGLSIRCVKD